MFERSIFYWPFENGWSGDSSSLRWWTKGTRKSIFSQDWGSSATKEAGNFPGFLACRRWFHFLTFVFRPMPPSLSRERYQRWHRKSEGKKVWKHFPLCVFHLNSIIFLLIPPRLGSIWLRAAVLMDIQSESFDFEKFFFSFCSARKDSRQKE